MYLAFSLNTKRIDSYFTLNDRRLVSVVEPGSYRDRPSNRAGRGNRGCQIPGIIST